MPNVTTVTRENFAALLPSVLHHIRDADFVAFDAELSGLCAEAGLRYAYYDTPAERYAKLRASALSFGTLQYGLAAFKWAPSSRRYEVAAWSFHVFPAGSETSGGEHACWALQLSTVRFLAGHGFDFNRTLRDGVPCASLRAEEEARRERRERGAALDEGSMVPLSPRDAAFVDEVAAVIEKADRGAPVLLPACGAFRRLLLHQRLPARFPGIALVRETSGRDSSSRDASLVATFPSADEACAADAAFEASLAEAAGFRRVLDQVARHGRPLVGHNCWLDAVHAVRDVLGEVPATLDGFAEALATRLLPGPDACLFDTKNVARAVFRALDGYVPLEESIGRVCLPPGVADEAGAVCGGDSLNEVKLRAISDQQSSAGSPNTTGEGDRSETQPRDAQSDSSSVRSNGRANATYGRGKTYASSAYGGATPSELTLAAGNTSLETLATLADDVQRWGVRVPVAGGRTPGPKRGRAGAPERQGAAASFHDAGFDAFCTGKVFVALAALLAKRAKTDAAPEDVRAVVEALVRPAKSCPVEVPPGVLGCRDAVYMMTSDYEDGVCVRGDSAALAAQRHPDRTNVLVARSAAGAPLRTQAVLAALRAAVGRRTYALDGRAVAWPHGPEGGRGAPPDAAVSHHGAAAYALLPFGLAALPGAGADGSVSVAVDGVEVLLWPYAAYASLSN